MTASRSGRDLAAFRPYSQTKRAFLPDLLIHGWRNQGRPCLVHSLREPRRRRAGRADRRDGHRLAADGRRMRLGTDPPSRRVPLMSWSGHAARMADPVPVVAVSRSGTSATHVDAAFTPADLIEAWSEQLGEEAREVHGCPHRWKRRWPAPCLPNWQTRITGRLWAARLDRKNSQGRRTSAISPAR